MGSVVRPLFQRVCPLPDLPMDAQQVDVDLDETLENAPWMSVMEDAITPNDIWMSYNVHRPQSIVLCIDTSLSMTGEKLALTAVALAVVLLEFPEDPVSIVAFENEAIILKKLNESLSIEALVERFLDVPAQGYTHLEDGMKAALRMVQQAESFHTGRRPSVVLLTDGKYTAGRDPAYLANHFPHLVLLKMGNEKASQNLCRELATQGHGSLHEVGELEALPTIMYNVVKDLLRGHAIRA